MFSVSDLTLFEYCKRKLYLLKNFGLKEKLRIPARGKIIHACFSKLAESEQLIIGSLTDADRAMIRVQYQNAAKDIISSLLEKNDVEDPKLKKDMESLLKSHIDYRVEQVMAAMRRYESRGPALWSVFVPKIQPEQHIISPTLQIRGIVDCVEEYEDELIPIEIKTGKAPKKGVWSNHRLQLSAYLLMLSETRKKPVKKGIVRYVDQNIERSVVMNAFIRDEVRNTINSVEKTLRGFIPPLTDNTRKCKSCTLKAMCYDEERIAALQAEIVSRKGGNA
ncbi:MAG: CRISPR-associated protein Cas4 [Candidatus Nanoarchaeia archaeon]